jgi:hypothetical protein
MRQIAAPIAPLPPVTNARFNASPFWFAHNYIRAQCYASRMRLWPKRNYIRAQCYASRMRLWPKRQDTRTTCLWPDDLTQCPVHQTEALLYISLLELVVVIRTALRAWLKSARDGCVTAAGET